MNKVQTIQIYKTKTDFAVIKNRQILRRVNDRQYAFRIAKQVFDATRKLATGPVFFEDKTRFVSEGYPS